MIEIRFAKRGEIKTVRKMYAKGFEEYNKTEIFYYFLNFLNKNRIEHGEVLLAFDGKKPVGMCSFHCHPQIFFKSLFLENVVILQGYRRKSVGRKLVQRALKLAKAKGMRRVFSNTWPKNKESVKFHEKLGFKYCGKIADSQGEGEDYVFFSKTVK